MPSIGTTIKLNDQMSNALRTIDSQMSATIERFRQMDESLSQADDATEDMAGGARRAEEAFERVDSTVINIAGDVNFMRDQVDQANVSAEKLAGTFKTVVSLAAITAAGRAALNYINECSEAFNNQNRAEMQLLSTMRNMIEVPAGEDASQYLERSYNAILNKASEIQQRGIFGDEAMIGGAGEFATYMSDPAAIQKMMDTLSNYAIGMSGGRSVGQEEMVNYATNLGKIMTGAYDAMTKKGFEFTEAQKAVIDGTATQTQMVEVLGDGWQDMTADMRAAEAISQIIDESWAGLYDTMSDTPEGKITQLTNIIGDEMERIGSVAMAYKGAFADMILDRWDMVETVIDGGISAFETLMQVLGAVLSVGLSVASGIINNWSFIGPVVYGVIAALMAYEAASVAAHAAAAAAAMGPVLPIVLIGSLLLGCINYMAQASGASESLVGTVTGGINVVIAFFQNLAMTAVNVLYSIINVAAALCTNMETAFRNSIANIQIFFYQLLQTAVTVISTIAAQLSKLPFVEFDTTGLTSAANNYADKISTLESQKGTYVDVGEAASKGFNTYDAFKNNWASDSFKSGADFGDGLLNKVKDQFKLPGSYGTGNLFDMSDYEANVGGINENTGTTAGNTGAIKDTLEDTEEDIKYLLDIAEREAINRFTTADINLAVTNNNSISSNLDINDIMNDFAIQLQDTMAAVAEGV